MNLIGNTVFDGSSNKRLALTLARALIVAAACLLGTPPSMADTWEDVVAARLAGDNATAFQLALPLAREGDARAQGLVGFLYMQGLGVEMDREEGMNWYRLASEQGDPGAQANLCDTLSAGDPAKRDLNQAAHWCRLSAAQGYAGGLYHLGKLYYLGRGLERNWQEAYVWLSLAELKARHPSLRSLAANLKARALKGLTAAEVAEADRRISAWKSAQP